MKLEIRQELPEMNIFALTVGETPPRQVYIDGKRCPPSIERLILAGMDALTGGYVAEIHGVMGESK